MSEWITPVFDRTPSDVTRAKLQVQEWIKALAAGEEVTISDLKGYFNAVDINRIENNTDVLSSGTNLGLTIKTNWARTDLPTKDDVDRIIGNINAIIEHFELEEFMYEMPTTILTYSHANTLEHNLSLIKTLLDDMTNRVVAQFEHIDARCESEVTVTLSIPATNIVFDKVETKLCGKVENAEGVPLEVEMDRVNLILTSKIESSDSLPIKFDSKVECTFDCRMRKDAANPIIARHLTELGFECDTENSPSNPIVASCELLETNMSAVFDFLDPISVKFVNDMIIAGLTGAVTAVKTYAVKAEAEQVDYGMTTSMDFASMFIEAMFESVVFGANASVAVPSSEGVESEYEQVDTGMALLVTILVHATLGDLAGKTLGQLGGKTLKELSLREK